MAYALWCTFLTQAFVLLLGESYSRGGHTVGGVSTERKLSTSNIIIQMCYTEQTNYLTWSQGVIHYCVVEYFDHTGHIKK